MIEAPPPIATDAWTHKERCLYWARIFSLPYAEFRTVNGRVVKYMHAPGEAATLAAEALTYYAERQCP